MNDVNERRLALSDALPCSNTSDGNDGWVIGVVLDGVITVYPGIDLVVVIGHVREIIIVVFGVGED